MKKNVKHSVHFQKETSFVERLESMQACINSDGNVVVSTPDASMKVKIHLNDPDFFRVEWWGTTADCYDLANLLIQFANQYSQDL